MVLITASTVLNSFVALLTNQSRFHKVLEFADSEVSKSSRIVLVVVGVLVNLLHYTTSTCIVLDVVEVVEVVLRYTRHIIIYKFEFADWYYSAVYIVEDRWTRGLDNLLNCRLFPALPLFGWRFIQVLYFRSSSARSGFVNISAGLSVPVTLK